MLKQIRQKFLASFFLSLTSPSPKFKAFFGSKQWIAWLWAKEHNLKLLKQIPESSNVKCLTFRSVKIQKHRFNRFTGLVQKLAWVSKSIGKRAICNQLTPSEISPSGIWVRQASIKRSITSCLEVGPPLNLQCLCHLQKVFWLHNYWASSRPKTSLRLQYLYCPKTKQFWWKQWSMT